MHARLDTELSNAGKNAAEEVEGLRPHLRDVVMSQCLRTQRHKGEKHGVGLVVLGSVLDGAKQSESDAVNESGDARGHGRARADTLDNATFLQQLDRGVRRHRLLGDDRHHQTGRVRELVGEVHQLVEQVEVAGIGHERDVDPRNV